MTRAYAVLDTRPLEDRDGGETVRQGGGGSARRPLARCQRGKADGLLDAVWITQCERSRSAVEVTQASDAPRAQATPAGQPHRHL